MQAFPTIDQAAKLESTRLRYHRLQQYEMRSTPLQGFSGAVREGNQVADE